MSLLRRGIALAAVLVASAGGVVVSSTPASAAMPYCNNVSGVYAYGDGSGEYYVRYPTYQSGTEEPQIMCDMNYYNENGNQWQREAIRSIQWDLVWCYGQNISIDGEYGPGTREAVRNAQRAVNAFYGYTMLTVDGWAGPATRSLMYHVDVAQATCDRAVVINTGQVWLSDYGYYYDIGTPFA